MITFTDSFASQNFFEPFDNSYSLDPLQAVPHNFYPFQSCAIVLSPWQYANATHHWDRSYLEAYFNPNSCKYYAQPELYIHYCNGIPFRIFLETVDLESVKIIMPFGSSQSKYSRRNLYSSTNMRIMPSVFPIDYSKIDMRIAHNDMILKMTQVDGSFVYNVVA